MTTADNDTLIGFDGSADDTALVVLRRSGDTWHVEHTEGPTTGWVADVIKQLAATSPGREGVGRQAAAWVAAQHAGGPLRLDPWQISVLEHAYANPRPVFDAGRYEAAIRQGRVHVAGQILAELMAAQAVND